MTMGGVGTAKGDQGGVGVGGTGVRGRDQGVESGIGGLRRWSGAGAEVIGPICVGGDHHTTRSSQSEVSGFSGCG